MSARKMNTATSDSLTLRAQELIRQWNAEGYDYNDEFAKEAKELKATKDDSSKSTSPGYNPPNVNGQAISLVIIIVMGVALMTGIVVFLYRRWDSKKLATDIDIPEEDTIIGVDLDNALASVEKNKDYYQCIRIKYLILLRLLNDKKIIRWHLSKTPTQYTLEWKVKEFNDITNIFMKIRYGNYPATEELYQEECALFGTLSEIAKGGQMA